MRKIFSLSMAAPLLSLAALSGSGAAQASPAVTPQMQLQKAIAGRVAGKPVDCIQQIDIRSTRIIDKTAILYEMSGDRLYVNRPASGAESLNRDDILVTDTHSPQLCNVDIVRLLDQGTHMPAGSVGLGQFVPYVKPHKP